MKTTVDLPDELLHRSKVLAAQRRVAFRDLVVAGLEFVTRQGGAMPECDEALARLRTGFHLGGRPLTRSEVHERRALS